MLGTMITMTMITLTTIYGFFGQPTGICKSCTAQSSADARHKNDDDSLLLQLRTTSLVGCHDGDDHKCCSPQVRRTKFSSPTTTRMAANLKLTF